MFEISVQVHMASWLSNPATRWNAGLEQAGLQFRQHLARATYPPMNPGQTYVRTGTLADKANFNIEEPGKVMSFGSTDYLQWLLIPARTVQNWGGKREELFSAMQEGFRIGIAEFKQE